MTCEQTSTYLHGFSSSEQARLVKQARITESTIFRNIDFRNVSTEIKTFHFDNREPARRKTMIAFWEKLLLSAADQLLAAGGVTAEIVGGMRREMHQVQNDSNAVFFYSFVQARAMV